MDFSPGAAEDVFRDRRRVDDSLFALIVAGMSSPNALRLEVMARVSVAVADETSASSRTR